MSLVPLSYCAHIPLYLGIVITVQAPDLVARFMLVPSVGYSLSVAAVAVALLPT